MQKKFASKLHSWHHQKGDDLPRRIKIIKEEITQEDFACKRIKVVYALMVTIINIKSDDLILLTFLHVKSNYPIYLSLWCNSTDSFRQFH